MSSRSSMLIVCLYVKNDPFFARMSPLSHIHTSIKGREEKKCP